MDGRSSNTLAPPAPDFSRQVSEDNQYVVIVNALDPSVEEVKRNPSPPYPPPPDLDDQEDYLKMESFPIQLQFDRGATSQNPSDHVARNTVIAAQREEVPAYAETRKRNGIYNSTSSTSSPLDSTPPAALPEPLQPVSSPPTSPTAIGTVPSQYSYVTPQNATDTTTTQAVNDALMPSRVRFMSKSGKADNSTWNSSSNPYPISKRSESQSVKAKPPPVPPREDEVGGHQRHRSDVSPIQVRPKPVPRKTPTSDNIKINGQRGTPSSGNKLDKTISQLQNTIISDPEFSHVSKEDCTESLVTHNFNLEKAKDSLRVKFLLGMGIPYIDAADCERALSHCQHKTDRAAEWLLQLSEDIELRRT